MRASIHPSGRFYPGQCSPRRSRIGEFGRFDPLIDEGGAPARWAGVAKAGRRIGDTWGDTSGRASASRWAVSWRSPRSGACSTGTSCSSARPRSRRRLSPHIARSPSSPRARRIRRKPADSEPDRVDRLRSGQTLGAIFADLGLAGAEAHRRPGLRPLCRPSPVAPRYRIRRVLRRRDTRTFRPLDRGQGTDDVATPDGVWQSAFRACERETRLRSLRGTLEGALEPSILRAGGVGELTFAMADALQWDLDFTRDLAQRRPLRGALRRGLARRRTSTGSATYSPCRTTVAATSCASSASVTRVASTTPRADRW